MRFRQRLVNLITSVLNTLPGRIALYAGLILFFSCLRSGAIGLLVLFVLLVLKSVQLIGAMVWIQRQGEEATKTFREKENELIEQPELDTESRKQIFRNYMFDWFETHEPRWALLGLADWKLRVRGSLLDWLRELFFRFNTQSVLGSMVLVLAPSPTKGPWPDCLNRWLLVGIGATLMLNCFLMAAEILVGNALMGRGYSRYFHPDSSQLFTRPSLGRQHLTELINFSKLSLASLVVIAAACTGYFVLFGGFIGLSIAATVLSYSCEWICQRLGLWLEFFYFATTTFCTVGFGDIHPNGLGSRVLVTAIHFLTFGYVLFLLQTLVGNDDEPPSFQAS